MANKILLEDGDRILLEDTGDLLLELQEEIEPELAIPALDASHVLWWETEKLPVFYGFTLHHPRWLFMGVAEIETAVEGIVILARRSISTGQGKPLGTQVTGASFRVDIETHYELSLGRCFLDESEEESAILHVIMRS